MSTLENHRRYTGEKQSRAFSNPSRALFCVWSGKEEMSRVKNHWIYTGEKQFSSREERANPSKELFCWLVWRRRDENTHWRKVEWRKANPSRALFCVSRKEEMSTVKNHWRYTIESSFLEAQKEQNCVSSGKEEKHTPEKRRVGQIRAEHCFVSGGRDEKQQSKATVLCLGERRDELLFVAAAAGES